MKLGLEMIEHTGSFVGPIDEIAAIGVVVAVVLTITGRWLRVVPRSFWFVVPVLLLAVGLFGTGIGLAQPEVMSGFVHPLQVDLEWSRAFVSAFDPLRMALIAGGVLLVLSTFGAAFVGAPSRRWVRSPS